MKPAETDDVEAVQWDGTIEGYLAIRAWVQGPAGSPLVLWAPEEIYIVDEWRRAELFLSPGDWIFRGPAQPLSACEPEIFEAYYDPIDLPPDDALPPQLTS